MDMQLQFDDVVEKFRTLRMYAMKPKPADGAAVDSLHQRWDELVLVWIYVTPGMSWCWGPSMFSRKINWLGV